MKSMSGMEPTPLGPGAIGSVPTTLPTSEDPLSSSFLEEDNLSIGSDQEQLIPIQIYVPDLLLQKCMPFHRDEYIWSVKTQILSSLPKELKESFNYGLFCPPVNGKAGKFLDEERALGDYPFEEPGSFLELRYKRRIYKMMNMEEKQVKQLHTRANLRRMLENVSNCHVEKVSKLCARGLDPNFHCPETGETPLTIAVGLSSPAKLIMTLVNGGALLDFRTKDGRTALHRAIEKDNYDALKTLLDLGSSPNYKDSRGLTSLYYTVLHGCDPRLTELLLHDHAMIGATDPQGWQEVHQACKHGMVQHLEHLLFYGADMNAHNASGNTPLHVCAVNDKESCARVLLFRGADKNSLNYANQNPYQVAVIAGNLNLAEIIQNHRPEDVVPYREAPKYNPRRRASSAAMAVLNRTHSDPRMEITIKPPSPCPSNRSLPPFSSVSTTSEASTGSSTCTQPSGEDSEDTASASIVTDKSMTSDSSGVCTSNSGTSYESCSEFPETIGDGSVIVPGAVCVCVQEYQLPLLGHLNLARGDLVEVTAITDTGLFEGRTRDGDEGFFPPHCVQEVKLRNTDPPISSSMGRSRVEGRREMSARKVSTVPRRWRNLDCRYGEPRTVILHKGKKGFGFVLRGAKATSPLMERQPTEYWPSLQYLDDVDSGGVADMAGLKKGDFLLEINGQDVSQASHEHVVTIIRQSGDLVAMTVVTVQPPPGAGTVDRQLVPRRQCATLPRKLSAKKAPAPPKRDPKTTLSVGRARARSMVAGLAEIEVLDRSLNEYDSEGRSTKSSSIESIPNKQGTAAATNNSVTPSENGNGVNPATSNGASPGRVPVASIRARPSSRRITASELQDFFSRQRNQEGTTSYSTLPSHLGRNGKIPKVYGSVAAMKRCKATRGKILDPSNRLHKDFHSSPDLNASETNDSSDEGLQLQEGSHQRRRSHSQEDISAMHERNSCSHHHSWACPPHAYHSKGREGFGDYKDAWKSVEEIYERVKAGGREEALERTGHSGIYAETLPIRGSKSSKLMLDGGLLRSSCPPPSHPPPPPPVGQVIKVDVSRSMGEYANVYVSSRGEKSGSIMSSFRPGDNAKLYESPDAVVAALGTGKHSGHSRRSSSSGGNGNTGSSLRSQSLPPRIANNVNHKANKQQQQPPQQPRSGTSSEAENSGDSGSLYTAFKVLHRQRDSLSSDSGLVSDRGTLKSVKGKPTMARPYSPKFACPDDSEVESPQHYPPIRTQTHEPFIPEPDYDSSDEEELETSIDKNALTTFGKADGGDSPSLAPGVNENGVVGPSITRAHSSPSSPHPDAKIPAQEVNKRLRIKPTTVGSGEVIYSESRKAAGSLPVQKKEPQSREQGSSKDDENYHKPVPLIGGLANGENLPNESVAPVSTATPVKDVESLPSESCKAVMNGDIAREDGEEPRHKDLSPLIEVSSSSVKENIYVFERKTTERSSNHRIVPAGPPAAALKKTNEGIKNALAGTLSKLHEKEVRVQMKTSKSCPKDFIQEEVERADNSSSGVSSDIETMSLDNESHRPHVPTSATLSQASHVLLRHRACTRKTSLPESGPLTAAMKDRASRRQQVPSEPTQPIVCEQNHHRRALTKHAVSLSNLPPPAESGESSAEGESGKSSSQQSDRKKINLSGPGHHHHTKASTNQRAVSPAYMYGKGTAPQRGGAADQDLSNLSHSIEQSLQMIRLQVDSLGLAGVTEVDVMTELLPPPPGFDVPTPPESLAPPPPEFSDGGRGLARRTSSSASDTSSEGGRVNHKHDMMTTHAQQLHQHHLHQQQLLLHQQQMQQQHHHHHHHHQHQQQILLHQQQQLQQYAAARAAGHHPNRMVGNPHPQVATEQAKEPVKIKTVIKEFRQKPLHEWSIKDVCDWLESLFLAEYKPRFIEASITGAKLANMDNNDLMGLGVKQVGHRLNMERSIKRYLK